MLGWNFGTSNQPLVRPILRHGAIRRAFMIRIMWKRNGSQARDPVKGVKAKYQLAVTKEPLLSVIVEVDAHKATRAKIEACGEQCGRFGGAE